MAATTPFRRAFDALDADGDGRISPDDLRTLPAVPAGEIDAMIAAADVDENGYVEFEEFEKILGVKKGGRGLMGEVFGALDRDGDGKVGFEDLKEYFGSVVGVAIGDEEVRAMIEVAGGDDDGGLGSMGFCAFSPSIR